MLERSKARQLFVDAAEGDTDSLISIFSVLCEVQGWEVSHYLQAVLENDFWMPDYLEDSHQGKWGMSTADAVRCLVDFPRTEQFLRAIMRAGTQAKKDEGKHYAIEAGTGTGILAVAMVLAGYDEVTAIEINPKTAELASDFVRECGVRNQVHIIQSDATQAPLNHKEKFDLLVSENLHTGLLREPQCQIMQELLPRLKPSAKVIPQQVSLSTSLAYTDHWSDGFSDTDIHSLAQILQLTPFAQYDVYPFDRDHFVPRRVDARVTILVTALGERVVANTLLLAMAVHLDDQDTLQPDNGRFLGSTHAIKLRGMVPLKDKVTVSLNYEPGCQIEDMKIRVG